MRLTHKQSDVVWVAVFCGLVSAYIVAFIIYPSEEAEAILDAVLIVGLLMTLLLLKGVSVSETAAVHPEPPPVLLSVPQLVGGDVQTAEECVICCMQTDGALWSDTPCGHGFHTECINLWFHKQVGVMGCAATCPICRGPIGV